MLTVHHLEISQSERIVWLCEELQIPYQLKVHRRDPVTSLAPQEYQDLHPLGTAPIITDGDIALAESGAIIEYVIRKHGDGRLSIGPDSADYAEYLFWFHFANGSLMPMRMLDLIMSMVGVSGDLPALEPVRARTGRMLNMLDHRLRDNQYLAGDLFSAADIMNFFPLTTMNAFAPIDLAHFDNLQRYIERVSARPAYQRAVEKGDRAQT
jgi:glutathione S-transferase